MEKLLLVFFSVYFRHLLLLIELIFLCVKDYSNDLWKYQINESRWSWYSGEYYQNNYGFYGHKNEPDPRNVPGGRNSAAAYYDRSRQELWVFGGQGYGNPDKPEGLGSYLLSQFANTTFRFCAVYLLHAVFITNDSLIGKVTFTIYVFCTILSFRLFLCRCVPTLFIDSLTN